ncbi:IS701 family transposase [Streptomyces sp. NPDC048603]|uniref:IS701 family transposase n=1 Tax=Streptomyces sp. NPDC048603 TaxID=3365577 RepID=UPI00371A4ABF
MRLVREEISVDVRAGLCAELFAALPRSDQRRKGELYVRGLLLAGGRKSIRNIAACVGDRAAEQSLHHFISCSTWDWNLVRAALARHLEETLRPRAWVAHSVVIPKTGHHTVGVRRRFVPSLGQVVNSQQAFGLWAANEAVSVPVSWQLLLSGDGPECVAEGAREVRDWAGGPVRPVVLDLPDADPAAAAVRFEAAGLPFVMSVSGATPVTPAAPDLLGGGGREFTADQLLRTVRTLRRPVTWRDPESRAVRTSWVAAVPVRLPGARRPMLLLGEWDGAGTRPVRCWMTRMVTEPWGRLLRLTRLTRRVALDFGAVSARVGMVDFEGRSFEGWHRHTTLASVAHAVRAAERAGAGARVPQPEARPA